MKESAAHGIKSRIIVHVLDFLDTKEPEHKKKALEELSEYAKFYRVPLRRQVVSLDLKKTLRKFILNREGYITTLPNLYNSLNNG